ncbi:MAG: potassium channel family protein [Acidimicrobiales bacterium]
MVTSLIASRVRLPGVLLALAVAYGTAGFVLIEGFSVLDAVYMTVTTLTTVGFGEIHPLGPAGRAFTMSLILFGVVALFAFVGNVTTILASGELGQLLLRRTMRRRIEALDGHFVICAYGRVGRAAAAELIEQGAEVVVVEIQPEYEAALAEAGIPYLIADPTEEAVLLEAGITRAKGLVCAVDSDAVNVYVTLTARALNADLFIVARASRSESVDKLERAGSNRVVSPYALSGARMAALALRPAVLEFMDMVSIAPDLRIEELVVDDRSGLAGRTVRDACAPCPGVMLLALQKRDGEVLVPPRADSELGLGDLVIALGSPAGLALLAGARR